MKKRFLFVVHDALGWRTLAHRLRKGLPAHKDIEWKIVPLKATPLQWRFMWQPNVSHYGMWHIPLFDSFEVFKKVTANVAPEASNYDAVLAATQSMAAGLLSNGVSVPIVAMIDATRPVIRRDFGATNISAKRIELEQKVFRGVTHIISLSTWAGESITADFGLPPEKVTLLPPFAPIGSRPTRKARSQPRLNAIFIGGDFTRKGGTDLLNWYRSKLHNYVNLHIVTQRRFYVDNISGVTWHLDLDNDALLTEVLPTMDILCHPTKQDFSAVVIAEAAALGVPSIASAMAGIVDLIEDGATGFLIGDGDEVAFIEKIIELYHKREMLDRMSTAAYDKAMRDFDQDKGIATIVRVLRAAA
jgi:hypothetical protein